jgi:polyprenyl P-hydroxybenzoate/phenylacrylic acid decarboxylase-like protein
MSGGFPLVFDIERGDSKSYRDFCIEWGFYHYEGKLEVRPGADAYQSLDHLKAHYVVHDNKNLGASIASGSFPTAGMIILPCSMNTLSAIATGRCDTLLTRAADVTLKEGRKLVLCVRETPLSKIHLRNMTIVSEAGASIMPICLPFYGGDLGKPALEFVDRYIARVLSYVGIKTSQLKTWKGV